jgi:seryl-tRNA synthetase
MKFVRDNTEKVQAALKNRGGSISLEAFLSLEKERRDLLSEVEGLKSLRNTVTQEISRMKKAGENADAVYLHFKNWIDSIRARNWKNLTAEILDGHISTSLCHLGNIACRLGRSLEFDPAKEKFVKDPEADKMLTRNYRAPYLLPEKV